MHVFAGFESSEYLEMAIEQLIVHEVEEKSITVVPMQFKNEQEENILDTMHHSDGVSLSDGIAAWAMVGMLLGVIYGSQVRIGPVALGIVGALTGSVVGYFLDRRKIKKGKLKHKSYYLDFLLIIRCEDKQQMKQVKSICNSQKVVVIGEHKGDNKKPVPQ
jgi:hypothetical protein